MSTSEKTTKFTNKDEQIDKFIFELPALRARIGMSQDEVGEIIGISTQTSSSVEIRRRKLSWTTIMSLLFLFYVNDDTRDPIENAGLFPKELKKIMNTNHWRLDNQGGV